MCLWDLLPDKKIRRCDKLTLCDTGVNWVDILVLYRPPPATLLDIRNNDGHGESSVWTA